MRISAERAREAALPVVLLAVGIIGTGGAASNQPDAREPDLPAYVLVAVAALALTLRRRPGWILAVNGLAVAAYLAAGFPYGPILLTVPVAAYGVAETWPVRRAAAAAGALAGVVVAAALVKELLAPAPPRLAELLWLPLVWCAVVAAAFVLGSAVRARRLATAGVRVEQARRAASEERLRMAQELHDTIGHGLAAIAMQAGVALHVLSRDPQRARESMEAVRATSREALDGLRAELDALRSPDGRAARRPAPGLEDLERLVDRVRAGGVPVRLEVDPRLPALPPEVDTAAYRILQESLTNVLRHAGPATARVSVRAEAGELLVEVTDSGRGGVADPVAGSGILGMRARAVALGGTLVAGTGPDGGFAVSGRLPVSGPAAP